MFDWFLTYLCFIDISGLLSGAQSLCFCDNEKFMFDWFLTYLCFIDISGLLSVAQSRSFCDNE